MSNEANQAGWTQATYITPDTEAISARATEAFNNAVTDFAKRAATFPAQNASPEQQRKLTVLKNTLTMASPSDPKEAAELAQALRDIGYVGTVGLEAWASVDSELALQRFRTAFTESR